MARDERRERRRSRSRSPRRERRRTRSRSPHRKRGSRSPLPPRRDRDSRSDKESRSDRDRDGNRGHRDRDRRDRETKDSRSRRNKSRSREPKSTIEDIVGREVSLENFDIESEQKKLDILMQQRRERVEKWRAEQSIKRGTSVQGVKKDKTKTNDGEEGDDDNSRNTNDEKDGDNDQDDEDNSKTKKGWTLDDEDDEDDDMEQDMDIEDEDDDGRDLLMPKKEGDEDEDKLAAKAVTASAKKSKIKKEEDGDKKKEEEKEDEEEEVDPLEAFMKGIQAEVKSMRSKTVKEEIVGSRSKLIVASKQTKDGDGDEDKEEKERKKKKNLKLSKGELLEQNQDAMEYSSEDESGTTTEADLQTMSTNLINNSSKLKLLSKVKSVTIDDISWDPFQKNFYVEVPELKSMTKEQVDNYRKQLGDIQVKGKGHIPKPIMNFAQAGLTSKVMKILDKYKYDKPTPIQAQAIPAIMSGRDLIGIAKTGSGKTLAFLLPMLRHIQAQEPVEPGEGPIAVVMTPTRELATQIWSEIRKFIKAVTWKITSNSFQNTNENIRKLRAVAVYGGTPISEQISQLKPGAEIVVCTPGRMIDMLAANNGRVTNLRRTTYIVLDEADRMFDMGFEPQVMRILDSLRPDRQMVMFSATFPRLMEALARRSLDKPVEVIVGGRSIVCKEVEQHAVVISEDDKFLKLLEVLGLYVQEDDKTAIVFVDKQESADSLLKELMLARYTCLALHGGIDQNDRDSIISDFKNGRVKVLVATSVAARGLDVKHCSLVVNYDCPNHYEDYVHRVGRTGRAGTKGTSYTFITREQGKYSGDIIKAFDLSGLPIPQDVQLLFNQYKIEQNLLGKQVKSGGGFSGRGFKFDETEAAFADTKKKIQKAAFGLADSDDDEDNDLDKDIMTMLAPKKTIKSIAPNIVPPIGSSADPVSATSDKLEAAKRLAAKLAGMAEFKTTNPSNLPSVLPTTSSNMSTSSTEKFLKGESMSSCFGMSANLAKSIAEQRAERVNARLNYIPNNMDFDENGEMIRTSKPDLELHSSNLSTLGIPGMDNFQRFEEELEINDFPQQARWRVTSREALAQISEYSEAGLTVRGTYYAPGTKVPEGERKLYLAIEGTNELNVSKARTEIIRLIKEELTKLQNSFTPMNKGRYKVV